jgi:hypothetical protein
MVNGQSQRVMESGAFGELHKRPGIAVIDFAHHDSHYAGAVVSILPLGAGTRCSTHEIAALLDLPPGTLTQRTLIYAVRIHPESPASTTGQLNPQLLQEAETHSQYQATIRLQGHHLWNTRFQRINRVLPAGWAASEVCAESWPGQGLIDAATECVRSWRLSSGHWGAVRTKHPYFAYDMKRGSNGVWYATGIFGG